MKLTRDDIEQLEAALEKAGEGAGIEVVPPKPKDTLSLESRECSCPYCYARGPCGFIEHKSSCRYS